MFYVYMKRVILFCVPCTEEGDQFDSLRVSPLKIKFCTKTKTKRTTFLGRVCHWIEEEGNSKFVSMNNMLHEKSILGSRHKTSSMTLIYFHINILIFLSWVTGNNGDVCIADLPHIEGGEGGVNSCLVWRIKSNRQKGV